MKYYKFITLIVLCSARCLSSGLPLEYLSLFTASARSAGFGNAYTAYSGDASCAYWNPAGITKIYRTEINVLSIPLFAGTFFTGLNFAFPIDDENVLGLSLLRLNSGYVDRTDSTGASLGYNFNETQSVYIVTYSHLLTDRFAAGINLKSLYQNIDTYSCQGYGIDFGILYQKTPDLSYGMSLQNVAPIQFGSDTIGSTLKMGAVNNVIEDKLTLFADLYLIDIFGNQLFRYGAGLEYSISENVSLRTGANHREITFGFGLSSRKISLDYAVALHPVDYVHKFSVNLKYDFLPSEEEIEIANKYIKLENKEKQIKEDIKIERDKLKRDYEKLKLESWINARLTLAKTHIESEEYDEAKKILNEIIQKDPKHEDANILRREINRKISLESIPKRFTDAQEYYMKKKYADTVKETRAILSINPDHKDAQTLGFLAQSRIFIQDKKYNEAKSELIEVLKVNPQNEEATLLLKRVQTIIDIMGYQK